MIIGVYPGTFDPFTFGHLDIAEKAARFVDKLYLAVAIDSAKSGMFTPSERIEIINQEIKSSANLAKIEIVSFKGLLINFAREASAQIIIRGLRAVSDFEYEFQMSCMNSKLNNNIDTIFIPASEKMQLVSSRMVKEVVRLGGETPEFASQDVQNKIKKYYSQNSI
jgi:pantetheine-phosphate adenylyltransferase